MLYSLWRDPTGDSEAKVLFLQDLVGHLAKGDPEAAILRNATPQELSRDSVDERWKQVKERANAEFLGALMDEQISLTHKASSFMVAMSATPEIAEPLRQTNSEAVGRFSPHCTRASLKALAWSFAPESIAHHSHC